MKRIATLALAIALCGVLTLCGCSGRDPITPTTGPTGSVALDSSGPTVAASPGSAGAAASSAAAAKASANPAVDGVTAASIPDQICIFLDRERLALEPVSAAAKRQAKFASEFKAWVAQDKDRKLKKDSEFDTISTSHCPKVRTRILSTLGSQTLSSALS
jgi:flagellar basal body L-ring protein FlgH